MTRHEGKPCGGSRGRGRRPLAAVCCVIIALATGLAAGQPAATDFPTEWTKVEPHEKTLAYRNQLREGVFEEAERAFLVTNALPQLGLPANRALIDRVRRRMRDVLCAESGSDPKALEGALRTTGDFMKALAANEKADMVVRVNAMLLVGELRAKGKPWPPAAATLVESLGNPKTPLAIRIAAAVGLARHVEAGTAPAASVGPLLVKLVGAPAAAGSMDGDNWLAMRSLGMLAALGTAAPANTAAVVAKVMNDPSRPLETRIRAAAALGSCSQAAAGLDANQAVKTIRDLSIAALRNDQESPTGFDPAAGQPGSPVGDQTGVFELACRRTAWRLATLARGLQADDGSGGIASAGGGPAAKDLATTLRKAAAQIDAMPETSTVREVLAELSGEAAPGNVPGAKPTEPAQPEPESAPPFANPFGK